MESDSADLSKDVCPFCTQDIKDVDIIKHYRGYFSKEYSNLKKDIIECRDQVKNEHDPNVISSFQISINTMKSDAEFWKKLIDIKISDSIDSEKISLLWKNAQKLILEALDYKVSKPLEEIDLTHDIIEALGVYEQYKKEVEIINENIGLCNDKIKELKNNIINDSLQDLENNLFNLEATNYRYSEESIELCNDYIGEENKKKEEERKRSEARENLKENQEIIFNKYMDSINNYLEEFLADFRIVEMKTTGTRSGNTCSYELCIADENVPIQSSNGPCFKNTLSAGDRSALALAFFFATLTDDSLHKNKIIIIDDPMTSLDEERSERIMQEITALKKRVKQVIVLSHSKKFLCQLWKIFNEGKGKTLAKKFLRIVRREGEKTSDIKKQRYEEICMTNYYELRRKRIESYTINHDEENEGTVATSLRIHLEEFLKFNFTGRFETWSGIGSFIKECKKALSDGNPILSDSDINELDKLNNYARKFHHSDPPPIHDKELRDICKRVLKFTT